MVMRVGGIVSGMDIEGMVNKLMEAERMPLTRMKQQQTTLTWKRDAFREINSVFLELKNLMTEMKLSTTYNPKIATSTQENAVKATATSKASNGSYEINVKQLATNAINVSEDDIGILGNDILDDSHHGTFTFYTYDESGEQQTHTFEIKKGDTLNHVLERITNEKSNNVRAFLDETSGRVVLETTRTGNYNSNGPEITFSQSDNSFFTNVLKLDTTNETGGQNAKFTYNNGLELESKNNNYTLNDIHFEFNNVTDGNARITVNTDVEQSFDAIMKFVDTYNKAIELMNKSQTEEKFRDFPPLTDDQKQEMSEEQIKNWEEKAKSGILRGESTVRDSMYALRRSLQSVVENGGEYKVLSQIGIKTTINYLDGGILEVNEEKLKEALRDNPDDVYRLFSNSGTGEARGLINRFDDTLGRARKQIEEKAGNSTHTLDNYTIGKRMKELNERISDFEKRMIRVEQRYWNQFTQMEKAIANLNQQSSYLFSQFGGM